MVRKLFNTELSICHLNISIKNNKLYYRTGHNEHSNYYIHIKVLILDNQLMEYYVQYNNDQL